jgi:hypothetical protein
MVQEPSYFIRSSTPNGTQIPTELLETSPNSLRDQLMAIRKLSDQRASQIDAIRSTVGGRNALRIHRRDGGEEDVSSDEEEGPEALAPLLVQTMTDVMKQVGSKVAADTGTSAIAADVKGDRFVEKDGASRKTVDDGTPQELRTLWNFQQYIPIQAFTSANLQNMKLQKLKTLRSIAIDGVKKTVLNTDTFGPEEAVQQVHWLEGWHNFLDFIGPRSSAPVFTSVKEYFTKLQGNPLFYERYHAFLKFDIEQRSKWFQTGGLISQDVFHELPTFIAHAAAVFAEQALSVQSQTSAAIGPICQPSTSHRWSPYPQTNPFAAGYPQSFQQPFQSQSFLQSQSFQQPAQFQGKRGFSGGGPRIFGSQHASTQKKVGCIRCTKSDHRAATCTATHTAKGTPIFSTFTNGNLVDGASRAICPWFNIKTCTNRGDGHGMHVCSVCGASGHGAIACSQ